MSASFEEIAEALAGPPDTPFQTDYEFVPSLTPEQMGFYKSEALYCLAHGERFSGKTYVAGHKIVKHCWENWNALAVVVVAVRRQATDGGIMHTLMNEILPEWKNGQPGFDHSDQKQDAASKDLYLWVRNKWGGWSQIKLVSMPHGNQLSERVRGTAPSLIYVDEAGKVDGSDFFTVLMQQLGRRPHIDYAKQQWVATCNPEGTSHWLYEFFFVKPKRADGTLDPAYEVIHLPIGANPDPRAQQYFAKVKEATQHDPIEYQRLVLGIWVDRPSGDAIFAAHFDKNIHVKGDFARGEFLLPKKGIPITVGYDLGDKNHAIIFLQSRPTQERELWLAFDEITVNRNGVSFDVLAPALLDKMNYWCDVVGYDFTFQHISDKSAFNRFRAASGSYDHLQIEKLTRELLAAEPERWPHLKKSVRMIECPKPPGSVAGRIKTLMNLLGREEIFFSAKCQRLIEAVANIESEKGAPFEPARKGDHIHPFDALTYPLFYHALGRPRKVDATSSPSPSPGILKFGGNNSS